MKFHGTFRTSEFCPVEPFQAQLNGRSIDYLQRIFESSALAASDLLRFGDEIIERRLEYPMITFLKRITEGRTLYRFQTAVIQLRSIDTQGAFDFPDTEGRGDLSIDERFQKAVCAKLPDAFLTKMLADRPLEIRSIEMA